MDGGLASGVDLSCRRWAVACVSKRHAPCFVMSGSDLRGGQIFGGRAITKTGMGRLVEAHQRTFKYGAILGGSEEIMADLGIRQALRNMPNSRL